jgi:choline dehydrogenase-like flavoprotein
LEDAQLVRVYLYANVLSIGLAEGGGSVAELRCASDGDRTFRARGTDYVVAAGGIENARILLASRDVHPGGVGNGNDLVGRFFLDHFNVQGVGTLVFGEPERVDSRFHGFWAWDGMHGRGGLRMPDHRLREERLLNAAILLRPVPLNPAFREAGRTEGVDAFVELARSAAARKLPDDVWRDVCLAVNDRREVLGFVGTRLKQALGSPGGTLEASLQLEAEPAPNPDSRVTLSRETDRFGVPRARLDWRPSALDLDSIRRTLSDFAGAVGAAGLGRYRADFSLEDGEPTLTTTYHHMGTTRMGTDPRSSVVDPECRVHGVANLYVAGSSVFPTAGRSNPTFTLVALAVRLADRLRRREAA